MKKIILVLCVFGIHINAIGQIDTLPLKSIEGITNKMIELISGEIGEERNWEEYRNLFLPTAQKTSLRKTKDGKSKVNVMNLEEFVRNVGPYYARDGFEEYAIGLTINEFNGIATVFQSFYCRNLKGTYEKRGVNSYQLVYLEDRWWIASTLFTNETKDTPIPNVYLFKKYQTTSN
ncbi:hypothetical protein [Aquimarina pacifica]|uniref:hypothetical protein n=1 Tax=Aquimarina pacifica TaxID=1296415 RepID=UPI00046EA39F|nr:hypothetical protein [Aquimarina pacifica]